MVDEYATSLLSGPLRDTAARFLESIFASCVLDAYESLRCGLRGLDEELHGDMPDEKRHRDEDQLSEHTPYNQLQYSAKQPDRYLYNGGTDTQACSGTLYDGHIHPLSLLSCRPKPIAI